MSPNQYLALLKEWCDRLISLQITERPDPAFHGAVLCPACSGIHGRCADMIYPLTSLYRHTGDEKYLKAATDVFDWMETNMTRPDGSCVNDANSPWRPITVFFMIQLGEAITLHGDLLPKPVLDKWLRRLDIAANFISRFMETADTVVNYPVNTATALALAGKLLNRPAYTEKAALFAEKIKLCFEPDGLLFGEGKPAHVRSPKGARAIDLGYNVEESLPAMVLYANLTGDKEMLSLAVRSLDAHLEFMLPDGAWDNGWGNRQNKWTYWGSRTSDGCQVGLVPLAKDYPRFAEAAQRNFELYRRCTHDGLLYAGLMQKEAGEPPCVHHTFCHAKAVAAMVDQNFTPPSPRLTLPRETASGILFYPSARVWLLAKGDWRATISDYDYDYIKEGHPTGGALSLLWHNRLQTLSAASMTEYQLVEPHNFQLPQYFENICQTPRIEYQENGIYFRSINDKTATVTAKEAAQLIVDANGILRDGDQNGTASYRMCHSFSEDLMKITLSTDAEGAVFRFPIIAGEAATVQLEQNRGMIVYPGGKLLLNASITLRIDQTIPIRTFHPVGGFRTVQLEMPMTPGKEMTLTMEVL